MGKMIGIDLGTTNSVVAICDGPQPHVLESREAKPQTRSAVSLRRRKVKGKDAGEDEILVGDPALDNWPMAPRDTIISIKRLMGRAIADPEVQKVRSNYLYEVVEPTEGTKDSVRVKLGGKQYSPIDISAIILTKLKDDAEFRLGEKPTHAVITVPAYFSQIQRDATRKAALQAGLKVIKIVDEPTAAAISFGMEASDGKPKKLLVYDLGGGTFDISLLMWAGGTFAPLALEGDMWLGGDNFDQKLVDYSITYIRKEYEVDPTTNPRFMVELKRAAQKTKEALGASRSADIVVSGLLRGVNGDLIDVEVPVTREAFQDMTRPLVEQTVRLTEKALRDVNYKAGDIDYVLMAGNSTLMPMVQQAMEEIFGSKKVMRRNNPKQGVALGAAILAARIGERAVCQAPVAGNPKIECGYVNNPDSTSCEKCGSPLLFQTQAADDHAPPFTMPGSIAPFHYGTQSAEDKFNLYIEKGDPYPTEEARTKTFYTRAANARMLSIPVYGGEDLERASLNQKQGEAFAILPPGLPQDTPVHIKLWLNANGIFEVAAHLDSGTELHPWVVTGEQDAKAIEAIQSVERALAQQKEAVTPAQMTKLEEVRNRAFDDMRRGDFTGALKRAGQLEQMADDFAQGEAQDQQRQMLDNMVNFAEFLLHEYTWAIDPDTSYGLSNLVANARSALRKGDRAQIQEKAGLLSAALEALPEGLRLFLNIRGAINTKIREAEPAIAANLSDELDEIESAFKSRNPGANRKLSVLVEKVGKAIANISKNQPGGLRCSQGHPVPSGERNCPSCGEDTWIPRATAMAASSGFSRR